LPATVNREIACFKTIFSKALKNGKAEHNPVVGIKQLKENNERDRLISLDEFTPLLVHCPAHLKPIVKLAYHTGMRKSEILKPDLGKDGFKRGVYPAGSRGYQDPGTPLCAPFL
jgi:site-specific recombinase XerD